jgi:hypothetical protein
MGDLSANFSRKEFGGPISKRLVQLLQEVRNGYGKPMTITSGVRSKEHNDSIGGVSKSAHVPADLLDGEGVVGHAVDIACKTSNDRYYLLPLLWSRFDRIGIGRDFIHVDMDSRKPPNVVWEYSKDDHVA